jgi:serine O-acetyltransferase
VLGPFTVGDGSRVAAGAVVLEEVPPDSTAVGVPARVVRIAGKKVDYATEVDQINVTDPVKLELSALRRQVELMEQYIGFKTNEEENDNEAL